jgi:7-cyano-7-deazaguanine synthase
MKLTVVPNRNMLLLSIATAWAISEKADAIYYAAHLGDHAIYPDCRKVFVDKMREAIALADWHSVELFAPFEEQTKADIVRHGVNVSAPMELSWSCYKGGAKHCGKCGTCVERREAFQLAEVQDPTEYEGE